MTKPRVFVTRVIAQEALDKIAQVTEMEVWFEELPPPYEVLLEKAQAASGTPSNIRLGNPNPAMISNQFVIGLSSQGGTRNYQLQYSRRRSLRLQPKDTSRLMKG